jgi:hypothetical protein
MKISDMGKIEKKTSGSFQGIPPTAASDLDQWDSSD